MIRAALLIVAKDLRVNLRNRTVLILGFVAPLALAFVLNGVFGGIDDPDAPVTFDVALVDLDGGEVAGGFVSTVDGIAASGLVDLARLDDEESARAAVDGGGVSAAWVIPRGFSAAVRSGGETEILVIGDVDATNTASFARAVADRYVVGVGTSALAQAVAAQTGVADGGQIGPLEPLVTLASAEAPATILDPTTSLTAGMALFFVFFTAGLPLVSILEERSRGTLDRLLVAPVPSASITAGKAFGAILLGAISLTALMVASTVLMGADWGPPGGAILLAVAAVVAATGIMSVAGGLARTTEQAGNLQGLVAVVLGLLGGAFVPIPGSESGVVAQLQMLTPHGWFLEGLKELRSDGLGSAIPAIVVLLGMGAVTGAVGLRLARSMLRR